MCPPRIIHLENSLIECNHLFREDDDFHMNTHHIRIGCRVCTEPIMDDQLLEEIDLYWQGFQRYFPRHGCHGLQVGFDRLRHERKTFLKNHVEGFWSRQLLTPLFHVSKCNEGCVDYHLEPWQVNKTIAYHTNREENDHERK